MSVLCVLAALVPASPPLVAEELEAHPRPDWARPCALLNGPWRFDFDPDDQGLAQKWQESHAYSQTIQVPYPWQSPLSGVNRPDYQGAAWYERDVTVPRGVRARRVFLVFGAVDWHATVWVNGKLATEHEGGYLPFEVELTDLVKPGETARVTVRAHDVTDPETPTGKQTGWYTPTGGIWQSVYLEYRGRSFIWKGHITPDVDGQRALFNCIVEAAAPGNYALRVRAFQGARTFEAEKTVACAVGPNPVEVVLPIESPALWSPDSPTLYDARLELRRNGGTEDTVETYFGMRKIGRGRYGAAGHEYILLNGKPLYLRGALHQSFSPEGLYTHPDDAYIRNDYERAKEFGLNFIRIHIKVEEPRALYWADRLGVLLMCDMPNFARNTPRSRALWEQTLRGAIDRDFNHASIFAWCDFNETWGINDGGYGRETQEWVRNMYLLTKQLDPTRLVEDNSPCNYDHVATDINSWHFYIEDYEAAARHVAEVVEKTYPGSEFNYAPGWKQDTAPLINSEYGGVAAGSGDRDISWVFLFLTNLLRKYDRICGYVYTELEDIEWEHNGFMNYDRSPKEFNYPAGITLAELQGDEFPVLDCPPYQQVEAGTHVTIPVLFSHWSEKEGLTLRVSVDGRAVDGTPWDTFLKPLRSPLVGEPFRTTPQQPIEIDLPGQPGIMNVVVEVLDQEKRCAANYCVLDIRGGDAWPKPAECAVTFPVDGYAACGFEGAPSAAKEGLAKVWSHGAGYFEYQLRLSRGLKAEDVAGCRLVIEMGSKADSERLDWPQRKTPADYPQTDGKTWPSEVRISLNGAPLQAVTLENDFADARGVLSHAAKFHHGSCGALVEAPVEGEALAALRRALTGNRVVTLRFEVPADAAHRGGLALYGHSMGSWPSDPALVFSLAPGAPKPKGNAKVLNIRKPRSAALPRKGPDGQP